MYATDADLARVSNSLLALFPRFTVEEQRLGIMLYRLLARGEPVSHGELSAVLNMPDARVTELLSGEGLRAMVYHDDGGRVLGFGGLAVAPMHHAFDVDGRTLYTWCSWDSLFIPEMLGKPARVASSCPETGQTIRLTVTPDGVTESSHPDAVVSLLVPEALEGDARQTMASFCHYVFFFASRAAGEAWTVRHEGTFLISLDQAFALGKRKNAVQFAEAWTTDGRR
ncbi:MAG: alkylmercury lyase [Gemmatimonadetes bacterium]|nr:alkylmercury lyase [Gemmatimonadota bacterium]